MNVKHNAADVVKEFFENRLHYPALVQVFSRLIIEGE